MHKNHIVKNNLTISHRHQLQIQTILFTMVGEKWSFNLPVLILNRCWLKLEKIKLADLKLRLPPDSSGEAPEILLYYRLLNNGKNPLLAVQECWDQFGMEDYYRALRNCWRMNDLGNNGWTFNKYIKLISQYRSNIYNSNNIIPLIILARQESTEEHQIRWISKESLFCKSY